MIDSKLVKCLVVLAACGFAVTSAESKLSDLALHPLWQQLQHSFEGLGSFINCRLGQGSAGAGETEPADRIGDLPEISSEEEDSDDSKDGGPKLGDYGDLDRIFESMFNPAARNNVPWWKGDNVCVTTEEIDETRDQQEEDERTGRDLMGGFFSGSIHLGSMIGGPVSHHSSFGSLGSLGAVVDGDSGESGEGMMFLPDFHHSSCSHTHNKYKCITRTSSNGMVKTDVKIYRCCHGSRRVHGKPGCTSIQMTSMLDSAREVGGDLFAKMLTSAGLEETVDNSKNSTLFVPTDDAMRDFMDGLQDQNRVRRALGPLLPGLPIIAVSDDEFPAEDTVKAEASTQAAPTTPSPESEPESTESQSREEIEFPDPPAPSWPRIIRPDPRPDPIPNIIPNAVPDTVPETRLDTHRRSEDTKDKGNDVELEDRRLLVLAHRVDGIVTLDEMRSEALLHTSANTTLRVNVYPGPSGRITTVNCARVSKESPSHGGLVHAVDRVLRPINSERTLLHLVKTDPDLTYIHKLLLRAEMMDMLKDSKPMTAFLPSDQAFLKFPEARVREMFNGDAFCVEPFLRNLIMEHTVCSAAAAPYTSVTNRDGNDMLLRSASDKLTLNDVAVSKKDIMASNGVLHMLDEVLIPDEAKPLSSVLASHNMTRWHNLMERAGLLRELENKRNMTIFVPSDEALKTPEAELLLAHEDKTALRKALLYHVARPSVEALEMTDGQVLQSNEEGKHLRLNVYAAIPILDGVLGTQTVKTVQCGRLVAVDKKACGLVVHVVDKVLAPPTETVLGMLERDEFSILRTIVRTSSYENYLSSTHETPFTFLAPTDESFAKIRPEFLAKLKTDRRLADAFMQRHIITSTLCCSGVSAARWPFARRVGTLNAEDQYVVRRDRHNRVHIGDAMVQQCDKMATNGIMHVVNTALVPPTSTSSSKRTANRRPDAEVLLFGL